MEKYSKEFKLKVVKYYFKYKKGYVSTAKHFGLTSDVTVLHWVRRYKERGEEGLEKKKYVQYDGKFKENVVRYMHDHHLSYLETAIHFNLGDNNVVSDWEKIYYEKGPQGLYVRKKCQKSGKPRKMSKKPNKTEIETDLKDKSQKELLEEIEQLRMENAYLKKLQALVQKRTKPQQEKK